MKILVINPNSDPQMTAAIEHSANAYAGGRLSIECKATPGAPKFIETYNDELSIGPALTRMVQTHQPDFDGFVVACHADTCLDALKEISDKPVVGIGEASMKIATMLGHNFAVITTDRHSIPGKLALARKYHLQDLLVAVRAPSPEERDLSNHQLFIELARRAVNENLAEVIVLGCAGLTGMDQAIQQAVSVPALDGVVCGLMIVEGLVRYGVSTSKALGYNPNY